MHLQADDLVDIADGTRPESSAPHLAVCEACTRQLRDMRALMASVAEIDVPEPSPLFWDHLSRRVSDAVAAEGRSGVNGVSRFAGWRTRFLIPLSAVAVASLVVILSTSSVPTPRGSAPTSAPAVPQVDASVAESLANDLLTEIGAEQDPSLTLVASLTSNLDLEGAGEAGLALGGSADHAVTHMNDTDLRELSRLLKQALAQPGA